MMFYDKKRLSKDDFEELNRTSSEVKPKLNVGITTI